MIFTENIFSNIAFTITHFLMKKIILILSIAFISTSTINAQQKEKAVEKAVLTYIENFFENNFDAMNAVLHPRLSKRGLNQNGQINENLPPAKLKAMMGRKRAFPLSNQKNKVENITILNNTATARLTTGYPNMKWIEYVTLVNTDGKWKIIDLFWEYFPREKSSKRQKKRKKN